MAPTKRTKAQIASDRIEIARLYLQGKYQHEIAEAIGSTQEMISYDLKAIQAEWRDIQTDVLNELKTKELARVDLLERTYWQAWERSLEPRETMNEVDDGDRVKVTKRISPSNGNPAYLKGVMDCIDRRCKLLGLDAPTKSELSGMNGEAIQAGLTDATIDVIKSKILGISTTDEV